MEAGGNLAGKLYRAGVFGSFDYRPGPVDVADLCRANDRKQAGCKRKYQFLFHPAKMKSIRGICKLFGRYKVHGFCRREHFV